jgi:hypothetical protein
MRFEAFRFEVCSVYLSGRKIGLGKGIRTCRHRISPEVVCVQTPSAPGKRHGKRANVDFET